MDRRELGKQLFERIGELGGKLDLQKTLKRTAAPVAAPARRGAYAVLAYRRFWPPTPELRAAFDRQLDFLRQNFHVISLEALVEEARSGLPVSESSVAITIDGGHLDGFETAFPALSLRGLPATFFLPAMFVDSGDWLWFDKLIYAIRITQEKWLDLTVPEYGPMTFTLSSPEEKRTATKEMIQSLQSLHATRRDEFIEEILQLLFVTLPEKPTHEFAPLTWANTQEMYGMSFGSQTVTHSLLHTLADGEIQAELTESKRMIEEGTGRTLSLLCYPGGFHSDRAARLAEACGYRGAVVNEPGRNPVSADPFRILRAGVEPFFDVERLGKICSSLRLQRSH